MHRFPPSPRGLRPWALVTLVVATGCARPSAPATDGADAVYMGSESCQACHVEIHARWRDTLMANVLQDPRERPDVILGDFTLNDPLVTFTPDDVVFTYGSKWKQRYYTQIGDDYFIFPAQWDVRNRQWRRQPDCSRRE